MILIDTHTHIYLDHFKDEIENVIEKALKSGVKKLLLPNIDDQTIVQVLNLSTKFPDTCFPMVGLHPTSVDYNYAEKLSLLHKLLETTKFTGIGETGMDAYWDKTYLKQQEDSFITHLRWAVDFDLPVVIHSRETTEEIISIVKNFPKKSLNGVFHAFSGTIDQAKEAIDLGFYLGIGGVVTFKNSGLEKLIKTIGITKIVLETDSPYLTPSPFRGKRNESSYLIYIAKKIAEILKIPIDEVARITTDNAATLFNIEMQE